MHRESDEVTPTFPWSIDGSGVDVENQGTSWEQLSAFDAPAIAIQTMLVVDGPNGTLTAAVEVLEFWSGDRIALEARPGFAFPQDLPLAMLWLEERQRHFALRVSPF